MTCFAGAISIVHDSSVYFFPDRNVKGLNYFPGNYPGASGG
jgi:hypothetical protein